MMSHTVTVTRTTTSTTTSAIILNTGYCKTLPGILKILQIIGGAICIGIIQYYKSKYNRLFSPSPEVFFLCVATTCFIASSCLLLSCLCSLSTASIISKTLYEFIYHGVAFLLYLAGSAYLLWDARESRNQYYYENHYTVGVIGLVITALYLISTILAYRSYRGA
uniref:MARVEL domain-containing protein n=2 Tax=Clastoptera arizonana TaxID=38151 RepID=A0A1B6C0V8_9HEMI